MQPGWMQQATAQAAKDAPIQIKALPPVIPGRALHLDGDLLCYWAGGNEETTVAESRIRAVVKINALREQSGSASVVMHMTASASTKGDRRIIATVKPYQGQRKNSRRPKNWAYLREWIESYTGDLFKVKVWATREADDGIALCCADWFRKNAWAPNDPGTWLVAIGSGDKDMRMFGGIHVDWNDFTTTAVPYGAFDVKGHDGTQFGHRWFWEQMLQGDTADNIPGLPLWYGKLCGKKTAAMLLEGIHDNATAFALVYAGYEAEYGEETEDRFIEQAMLLWMRDDLAGDIGNVQQVLPVSFEAAINRVRARIKEKYDEAESLGSCAVQSDRT
jgi:hypothetical protein